MQTFAIYLFKTDSIINEFRLVQTIDLSQDQMYFGLINRSIMQDDSMILKRNSIKYLLFDLDGTLIDSSSGVVSATNFALKSIGERERAPAEITAFIGFPLQSMFSHFSSGSYSDFFRIFQEYGSDSIAASAVPIDGADATLRSLFKEGYKIGIGTTKMRVHINKILRKLDWENIIAAYAGADDVVNVKPSPEVYLKVMNLLGGNQRNSLVIGDTINDVKAARSAGLPVVGVNSPFGDNSELVRSRPDYLLNRISELPALLKRVGY